VPLLPAIVASSLSLRIGLWATKLAEPDVIVIRLGIFRGASLITLGIALVLEERSVVGIRSIPMRLFDNDAGFR
jgi:hypothetical protein